MNQYTHPQDTDAFPIPTVLEPDGAVYEHGHTGMTLRDWFAGQALCGLLAGMGGNVRIEGNLAEHAYSLADSMLEQRTKHP